jgi:NADH dehydrogenase
MPGNRLRTATDWLLDAVLGRQATQLGLVRSTSVPLDTSSPEVPHHPHMAFPPERAAERDRH